MTRLRPAVTTVLTLALATLLGGFHPAAAAAAAIPFTAAAPTPAAAPSPTPTLTVVTYNVGDGKDADKRADLLRLARSGKTPPAVIALQEVSDRQALLRSVAPKMGYRLITETGVKAGDHTSLLVRTGVRVLSHTALPLSDVTYVGTDTAGAKKDGLAGRKYIQLVRVQSGGIRWVVGVVHFVPSAEKKGNDDARALHRLQTTRSAAWFDQRDYEPVLVGDFNADVRSPLLAPLRRVAEPTAVDSHGRRAIDIVWAQKPNRVTAAALAGYSSDHRPVRATVAVPSAHFEPAG